MSKLIASLTEEDVKAALVGYVAQKYGTIKNPSYDIRTNGYKIDPKLRITARVYGDE